MDGKKARELLEARRSDLEDIVRAATQQGSLDEEQGSSAGGELSSADQHPADAATDTLEREMDLSVRDQAEASIRDVDKALERVEAGTYGSCSVCEAPIPDDRLEVRPEAEFCVEYQPATGV